MERVLCEVPPVVSISLVYDHPETPQEAQFSMQFAVAAVLMRGDLGIECLSEDVISDQKFRDAMAKVEMRRNDSLESKTEPESARVTLVTKNGDEISDYLGQPVGMPGNPMSDAVLHEKFRRCATVGGLNSATAEALLLHMTDIELAHSPLLR